MSEKRLDEILELVHDEVRRAQAKFPPIASPHEGKAVIEEELDELWLEVKENRGRGPDAMDEAKQTAAMAIRYMFDLACDQQQKVQG